MRLRLGTIRIAGTALLAAAAFLLAGCFSFDVGSAIGKQIAPKPAPDTQPSAQPAPQNEPAPAPKQKGGGSAMAYQYQFNAFYSGFWSMGWFGYKDINYIPISLVFLGRLLRFGGEYRKKHLRLFNRNAGAFTNEKVHEKVCVSGKTASLKNQILH